MLCVFKRRQHTVTINIMLSSVNTFMKYMINTCKIYTIDGKQ